VGMCHGKFYKTNGLDEKWITRVMGKVMLQKFWLVLLVRVGIPSLRESGDSTLRDKLGARGFMVVCVSPLCGSRGIRGKKSTPSVGWSVPVRSQRLAGGRKDGMSVAGEHHQVHLHWLRYLFYNYDIDTLVPISPFK